MKLNLTKNRVSANETYYSAKYTEKLNTGVVALYYTRPGKEQRLFLQPRAARGKYGRKITNVTSSTGKCMQQKQ